MSEAAVPILLVCYTFPPSPGIGGRRWAKFAKAFAQRGHPVHVICAEPITGSKPSYWTADANTPGITVHPLPRRYPMIIHRWPLKTIAEKVRYRLWMRAIPFLARGNPLDSTVLWKGQFLRKAGALIEEHGIRHVVVSGAPFRLLVYGLELKARYPGIRLLSDLRDPWTWWDNYGHGSLPPDRFAQEQAFERAVMEGSDRITTPHRPVVEHIRTHYPLQAEKCVLVPHAIDPDDMPKHPWPRNDGHFRMIYIGTLYGASEADDYFRALIQAFKALEQQAPERARTTSMTFLLTANDDLKYHAMVREAGLAERIRFEPPVSPQAVFARMAEADAALVFIPSKNNDLIGTKFQELFYIGRPVIHVGAEGEVSRTIEGGRLGISLRVEELARELPRIITGERKFPTDPVFDRSAFELGPVSERLLTELGV